MIICLNCAVGAVTGWLTVVNCWRRIATQSENHRCANVSVLATNAQSSWNFSRRNNTRVPLGWSCHWKYLQDHSPLPFMTHKLVFLRLLDSGTDHTSNAAVLGADSRDKNLAQSITRRKAPCIVTNRTSRLGFDLPSVDLMHIPVQLLWIMLQLCKSQSINLENIVSPSLRVTFKRTRLLIKILCSIDLSFPWPGCMSWDFHSPLGVVTFNFKFRKIITAFDSFFH